MRLRARYLAPLLCGLAIVPLGLWYRSHQQFTARQQRWEQREEIARAADVLHEVVELPAGVITLGQFRDLVVEQTALGFELSAHSVGGELQQAVAAARSDLQVEFPGGRLPLQTALSIVAYQLHLDYDFPDESSLVLTSSSSGDSTDVQVETFPFPQPELASRDINEADWAALIRGALGDDDWYTAGGQGYIEAVPGALVVAHTPRELRKVRRLMTELSKLRNPPEDLTAVPLWPNAEGRMNRRIEEALDEPTQIHWVEWPLDEALAELGRKHQIPILLRVHKLNEVAIPRNVPVTKTLRDVSLRSALRLLLRELELTYLVQDGALVITTPEDVSAGGLQLVAYPIHDLLGPEDRAAHLQLLTNLLTSCISPHSWNDVGGPAVLHGSLDGWLLINQDYGTHRRIEFVLHQLRQAMTCDEAGLVFSLQPDNERERRIRRILERDLQLDYDAMPLRDAVQLLSDQLQIPMVINAKRLEEAAISTDTPIRLRLPKRPAKQQLSTILAELELTWIVDDEVLQITTPDDACGPERLTTRLYDLRLLTDPDFGALPGNHLIEAIMNLIEPQSWDEAGGPGSLAVFRDLLVVTQADARHAPVERFLRAVEQHCAPQDDRSDPPQVVDPLADPRDSVIQQKLLQPIDFQVSKTPLGNALVQLAALQDLPLVVRHKRLEEAAASLDVEIDFAAEQTTVASILDRLLEPFDAAYLVQEGTLVVTGEPQVAEPRLRFYRIPTVRQREGSTQQKIPFADLRAPAVSWGQDTGTCLRLNETWAAYTAGEPLQRRIEATLVASAAWKRWQTERKALDDERIATSDWSLVRPGQRILAAQSYVDPTEIEEDHPFAEDFR